MYKILINGDVVERLTDFNYSVNGTFADRLGEDPLAVETRRELRFETLEPVPISTRDEVDVIVFLNGERIIDDKFAVVSNGYRRNYADFGGRYEYELVDGPIFGETELVDLGRNTMDLVRHAFEAAELKSDNRHFFAQVPIMDGPAPPASRIGTLILDRFGVVKVFLPDGWTLSARSLYAINSLYEGLRSS